MNQYMARTLLAFAAKIASYETADIVVSDETLAVAAVDLLERVAATIDDADAWSAMLKDDREKIVRETVAMIALWREGLVEISV